MWMRRGGRFRRSGSACYGDVCFAQAKESTSNGLEMCERDETNGTSKSPVMSITIELP